MDNQHRRLLWHGMFLFLLGVLTGFVEPRFANMRMGLAAHLEGVMNGTFLLALGAAWAHLRLSTRLKSTTFWLALYGTYFNWLLTTLAAILGTVALSPITAAGRVPAAPLQESFITFGFVSVGLAIVAMAILLLWGFRDRAMPTERPKTRNASS
ncbi:MAG: hydrogenase [Acidobacteriaceae bacterium]